MANNFQNGPGGRLQKEEEKNVNFGFMRPTISPLNQQQFMQVARGETTPQQTGVNAPVVFGQKPGSIGEKIGQALTLGKKPYPGRGFQFTPSETAKQTAIDFATGEAIGAGVKAAAPYVKPAMNKAIQYITTQTPLRDAYKLNPFAFKANPNSAYRMIGGKEGFEDAIESGVFRPNQKRGAYDATFYNTGAPSERYGGSYYAGSGPQYMAEVPLSNKKIFPRFDDDDYRVSRDVLGHVGINDPGSMIYKQDWLRGYKPVKFK